MNRYNLKVVLLGEGCVGKTSIVQRYVEDKFNSKHLTTLQAAFSKKKIFIDGKKIQLNIWDTAGQERFHALGPIYYRSSHGAVLVYDITDDDSFQKVKNWVKELKKVLGKDIVIIIVGNKTDLEKDRKVSITEAQRYAQSVGAKHFESSAKTNNGINEMFLQLTEMMTEVEDRKVSHTVKRTGSINKSNPLIIDDSEIDVSKANHDQKCCGVG